MIISAPIASMVAIAMLSTTAVAGEDWPHWRGPDQNGVSTATGLPTTWSGDTNIVWKTELPAWAGSTPVIAGDRIFLTSPGPAESDAAPAAEPQPKRRGRGGRVALDPGGADLLLLCVDKTTGVVRWRHVLDTGNQLHRKGNDASPSPVTDGRHVWALTGTGAVTAVDLDGNRLWQRKLQEMYGPFGLNWGYASSPLLHDGLLIVEVLHGTHTEAASYLVAFDALTGEVRWRHERPTDAPMESPDAYTTPLAVERDGTTQIIVSGADYVTAHDPADGRELWRVAGLNPRKAPNYRIVASPVYADGVLYAPTRNRPLLAFRLDSDSGPGDDGVLWRWEAPGGPDVPTPACDGRRFYMVDDSGLATCLDAKTGAVVWGPERTVRGTVSSSPLLADGKLYFTTEEALTVVLSAGDTFEQLAANELDGSYTLSSPVPSGPRLYIRTAGHLYCIGNPAGPSDRPHPGVDP